MLPEIEEKVRRYIKMVEDAISQSEAQLSNLSDGEKRIFELSKMYLSDSKYYLEKGDPVTALATISYSEGLLDSLVINGKLKVQWKREKPKKVLIAGSFDIIHPGHIKLIKEASKFGEVHVIVSRDVNAKKLKGRETVFPEFARLELVSSIKGVKNAYLGDESDFLRVVVEVSPDIVVLGPDQKVDESWLKNELAKRGLPNVEVIRIKERFYDVYPNSSTQVILQIMKKFCFSDENPPTDISLNNRKFHLER